MLSRSHEKRHLSVQTKADTALIYPTLQLNLGTTDTLCCCKSLILFLLREILLSTPFFFFQIQVVYFIISWGHKCNVEMSNVYFCFTIKI